MEKVRFACPRCQTTMQTGVERVGYDVACPHCSHRFRLVEAGAGSSSDELTRTLPPTTRLNAPGPHTQTDAPTTSTNPYTANVIDRGESPAKAPRFVCPYCQSTAPPKWKSEVSQTGWIVCAILLVTTCFFCFVGLFIRNRFRVCSNCRIRLE